MLEHVPEPDAVIAACATLIRDDGRIFLSTINRNPKAWLFAVIGAEYLLNMLPRGTHEYSKFIRPSEMEAWARHSGLQLTDLTGMNYNPLTREYRLGADVSINYLASFRKD
jgi:2-polyprenyl-6-hydroxyphenyl methylase/3-demethylubiquinone-9 3-methyltransferase